MRRVRYAILHHREQDRDYPRPFPAQPSLISSGSAPIPNRSSQNRDLPRHRNRFLSHEHLLPSRFRSLPPQLVPALADDALGSFFGSALLYGIPARPGPHKTDGTHTPDRSTPPLDSPAVMSPPSVVHLVSAEFEPTGKEAGADLEDSVCSHLFVQHSVGSGWESARARSCEDDVDSKRWPAPTASSSSPQSSWSNWETLALQVSPCLVPRPRELCVLLVRPVFLLLPSPHQRPRVPLRSPQLSPLVVRLHSRTDRIAPCTPCAWRRAAPKLTRPHQTVGPAHNAKSRSKNTHTCAESQERKFTIGEYAAGRGGSRWGWLGTTSTDHARWAPAH